MSNIQAAWIVNIKSGITEIELGDLGVSTKKEWRGLSETERKKRINGYLDNSDQGMIKCLVSEYEFD